MVSLLSNILEAYTTALFLVDSKNRLLHMVASQSLSKYLPEKVTLSIEQSGILGQVQKVGQTIHLDKVSEIHTSLSATLPFYREGESHIKGLFAVPVGDGAGVLYVDTKYAWGFNDKQQKWIREIADVLFGLVQRQTCLTQERDYARILELWHNLDDAAFRGLDLPGYCQAVIDECNRFLGTEYGFLALKEPHADHYHIFAATPNSPRNLLTQRLLVKHGLVGWIFQNGKNLLVTKLNPDSSDHFLFASSEGLPHHGTFWGLPVEISLGQWIVVAFLARRTMEWTADDQFAISHMLHFLRLLLEQIFYKEECTHLHSFDHATGLFNAPVFEAKMEAILTSSMQNSTPFTLTLIQFEPWQMLSTKAPPSQVRQWQATLAASIRHTLPSNVLIGQIAENRFGLVFAGLTPQEAEHHLTHLATQAHLALSEKVRGTRLTPYVSTVGFPQDGTRTEELWPLAYRHLFAAFRSKPEKTGT